MPTTAERTLKREIYARLHPYPREPIACDGPLYIALYDGQHDPIAQIQSKIDLSGIDSLQFLSGCRGSGKTTELHRLRHRLQDSGYIAFHVDALEYLNPAEPVEITELLVIIAASFSEQVKRFLGKDFTHEGYLERFWSFLQRTDITPEEFGITAGSPGFEADFKATLRTTPTFRQKIRAALNGRTQQIKTQAETFIKEAVQWLHNFRPGTAGIALLFDSLEQLRGSTTNESDVMASVETIFTQHRALLRFEDVHIVYTVPPWLRYRAPGAVSLEKMLPCVKLWQYDGQDHRHADWPHGWSVLREVIRARVGEHHMPAVFGAPDRDGNYPLLDRLIRYCGGHFRDLLQLTSDAFAAAEGFEISRANVDDAIANLRGQFPLSENTAEWLRSIHESQLPCIPDDSAETVGRFTRFLDHHLILLFSNGRDWYDIHPLIRDNVIQLSEFLRRRARESAAQG